MTYQERFDKFKSCINQWIAYDSGESTNAIKNIAFCREGLKQLQAEIKLIGCFELFDNDKHLCRKFCRDLCPTCQNLIKQIEELLK